MSTTKIPEDNATDPLLGLGLSEGLGPNAPERASLVPMPQPVAWRHNLTHSLHDTEDEVQLADAESWAEPLYTAAQVRYMLEGAWRAGYYDAGYTHDSAYAEKASEKCADGFLGHNCDRQEGKVVQFDPSKSCAKNHHECEDTDICRGAGHCMGA